MGSRGVPIDNLLSQYIISIYFVTTTLSTCGFGDIYATTHDPVEHGVILLLQFIGMLFYSLTINRVQSFLISDEILSADYSNHMADVVENLIVKVSKQLPANLNQAIPAEKLKEWKQHTLKYFRESPCAFLAENTFYDTLSQNMKI